MAIVWMGAKITWIVDGCKNYTGENSILKIYIFLNGYGLVLKKYTKYQCGTNLIIVLRIQI